MGKINWQLERRAIGTIKPYDKNPRIIKGKKLDDLKKSIEKFGLAEPLVINTDGTIIGGHARYYVLLDEKAEWVDCYVPDKKFTNKQVDELCIRLNKNIAGEWDFDILGNSFDLADLKDWGFDDADFGKFTFGEDNEKDDEIPDTPAIPKSQQGDLYEFGGHRVLCGDSTSFDDLERLMNNEKANMVFTDPPYNVNYDSVVNGKILNDKFDSNAEFYTFLSDFISSIKTLVLGDVYICMSSSELHTLQKAFIDNGGHWSTFIIWVKNTFTLGRSNYQRQYEPILYGWFEGSSHYFSGRRNLGDVVKQQVTEDFNGTPMLRMEQGEVETDIWDFKKPSKNKKHPTMKPVELCARGVLNSSLPTNIILDPFLGSGSTLIACEKTKRRCYGIELDPKYVDVIIERWCEYTGNTTVIKNGAPYIVA